MSAGAVDGVIEINQARALEGGVSSQDAPGLPVTLGDAGSYRLTGNLVVPDANTDGIHVTAIGSVHLDLNGFTISGPANCRMEPGGFVCDATGLGSGVSATGGATVLHVRGGTVRGMGLTGIQASAGSSVVGVTAERNGARGLSVTNASVSRCLVQSNGSLGIFASGTVRENVVANNNGQGILATSAVIEANEVADNLGDGIFAEIGSVIRGNDLHRNKGNGIQLVGPARVEGNTIAGSFLRGILGAASNVVTGNVVTGSLDGGIHLSGTGNVVKDNSVTGSVGDGIFTNGGSNVAGNVVRDSTGHGISVNGPSRVFGNTSSGNTRQGLRLQASVGFAENVLDANGEGDIGGGTSLGSNLCGESLCP